MIKINTLKFEYHSQTYTTYSRTVHCCFRSSNYYSCLSFQGLEDVEGIVVMDMEEEELVLDAKSFAYMNKLKLLEINNVRVDEDIQFLSNKLGILRWNGYPSKYLPSTFQPQSLLELHLPNSKVVRLWEGRKVRTYIYIINYIV